MNTPVAHTAPAVAQYINVSALWLIPAFPALAALLIFIFSRWISGNTAGKLAIAGVGLAFATVLFASFTLLGAPVDNTILVQKMWRWMDAGFIRADAGFYYDRVAMVFTWIVSGVGLLIHIYSYGYMHGDEGMRRYFGWLSLFVAAMLVLVTADNAFFMLLGWEGVGAASFALIGHYYQKRENALAAQKAFLVTRTGDVFLILGILLLASAATVEFRDLAAYGELAARTSVDGAWGLSGKTVILIAGLLLLGGVAGKSAQLPLQTWLPDAMAGPTPVSALIHAATMVTAGVYLIARFHTLYSLSPTLMTVVAFLGALTALYGASCALFQTDIKRILAYSTISQIGYMVLGLGVGAFSLGLFHFFTHAFYKALLFLGAGTVIHALHGEQNIYNMGGLKDRLKGTYLAFLAGAAALAGFPFTSGFFSKDAILWSALTSAHHGSVLCYLIGLLTAFLTAVYTFRLVFVVFAGSPRRDIHVHAPEPILVWPLVVLAVPSLVIGFALNFPHLWPFWEHHLLAPVLPGHEFKSWASGGLEFLAALVSAAVAVAGIVVAWTLYGPKKAVWPEPAADIQAVATDTPAPYKAAWANAAFHGWRMDSVYNNAIARPYGGLAISAAWTDFTVIAGLYQLFAMIIRGLHNLVVSFQNGRLTRYALVMLFGAVFIALALMLPHLTQGK